MMMASMLSLQLLLATALISDDNCKLTNPPAGAGETQFHGVTRYTFPGSHTISSSMMAVTASGFRRGLISKLNIAYLNMNLKPRDSIDSSGLSELNDSHSAATDNSLVNA